MFDISGIKNKNIIGIYIIYISFIFKSSTFTLNFLMHIPNTELNQHLEKPIKPKTFATKNINVVKTGLISKKPQNMKNSHVNFKVPGKPAYKIHIVIIDIPNIGVNCNIPETSTTDLELNLLCIQSTKKNINDDKNPCVIENKIPAVIALLSPQQNVRYIKFIS